MRLLYTSCNVLASLLLIALGSVIGSFLIDPTKQPFGSSVDHFDATMYLVVALIVVTAVRLLVGQSLRLRNDDVFARVLTHAFSNALGPLRAGVSDFKTLESAVQAVAHRTIDLSDAQQRALQTLLDLTPHTQELSATTEQREEIARLLEAQETALAAIRVGELPLEDLPERITKLEEGIRKTQAMLDEFSHDAETLAELRATLSDIEQTVIAQEQEYADVPALREKLRSLIARVEQLAELDEQATNPLDGCEHWEDTVLRMRNQLEDLSTDPEAVASALAEIHEELLRVIQTYITAAEKLKSVTDSNTAE